MIQLLVISALAMAVVSGGGLHESFYATSVNHGPYASSYQYVHKKPAYQLQLPVPYPYPSPFAPSFRSPAVHPLPGPLLPSFNRPAVQPFPGPLQPAVHPVPRPFPTPIIPSATAATSNVVLAQVTILGVYDELTGQIKHIHHPYQYNNLVLRFGNNVVGGSDSAIVEDYDRSKLLYKKK